MHIHTHPLLLDGASLLAHEARWLLLDDELGEPHGGAAGPHGAHVPPQDVGHELACGAVDEEGVHLVRVRVRVRVRARARARVRVRARVKVKVRVRVHAPADEEGMHLELGVLRRAQQHHLW